jgi:hypothetical protein
LTVGFAIALAVPLAAQHPMGHGAPARGMPAAHASAAAELRATLTRLLGEHLFLASAATGAALGGRQEEFRAAAAALDANSNDFIAAVGSIYGPDAQRAFDPLWKKHIGFVVDYTVGLATKDQAKQQKAVNDLLAYTQEIGAFLNSANPYLPKDAVANLVREHVLTLKAVIDAQAAGDPARAYMEMRKAYAHMGTLAGALTDGIVRQFPQRFGGQRPATMPKRRGRTSMAPAPARVEVRGFSSGRSG